jgi:hypothetical protein
MTARSKSSLPGQSQFLDKNLSRPSVEMLIYNRTKIAGQNATVETIAPIELREFTRSVLSKVRSKCPDLAPLLDLDLLPEGRPTLSPMTCSISWTTTGMVS